MTQNTTTTATTMFEELEGLAHLISLEKILALKELFVEETTEASDIAFEQGYTFGYEEGKKDALDYPEDEEGESNDES